MSPGGKTYRQFQYMLLLRGATSDDLAESVNKMFQYMLLLRGATDDMINGYRDDVVSIHAPLARSNSNPGHSCGMGWFQYMLLLRGAT